MVVFQELWQTVTPDKHETVCASVQAVLFLRRTLRWYTKLEYLLESKNLFGKQSLLEHSVIGATHKAITQHDIHGKRSGPR